ncbi:MAG TPA: hypothetical protein VE913_19550 [Longimicrobium sp.]|nr:hypothetical protein [Longimicrobium sp.]
MPCNTNTPQDPNRRDAALDRRITAAKIGFNRYHPPHINNCEENDYPYVANYSKGLQHDNLGDVDPVSYQSLLNALTTRNPGDFEQIILGPSGKKLTNPQAGLAFELIGTDPQSVTMAPAPRIDSARNSAEMAELYWMALARDVHFNDYPSNPLIQETAKSLNYEFSDFRGPRNGGLVDESTVFRGIFPGETTGPYLSQFLLKGNDNPSRVAGEGRNAEDGFIFYGAQRIDQRRCTVQPGFNYLTDFSDWLAVQNGNDKRGGEQPDPTRRFIRNLRDLATYVHFDNVADAFFNTAYYLLHEPIGNQAQACTGLAPNGSCARPGVEMEFGFDMMNPYTGYVKQAPFATYGAPQILTMVWEVMNRALRAVWYQKWFVHRRLRPEEFGGRIDNHLAGRRYYPIDKEILNSLSGGLLASHFPTSYGTYLLPQAYSEGAPTHPAYGAGHATGAGACATLLKAFFREDAIIENPMVPTADGKELMKYTGAGWGSLTLGGELNKLAGNIALGRSAAGVHWRSDYDQSLLLGERIAIRLLQEQSILYNEGGGFTITRFDGTCIKIWDGRVEWCPPATTTAMVPTVPVDF